MGAFVFLEQRCKQTHFACEGELSPPRHLSREVAKIRTTTEGLMHRTTVRRLFCCFRQARMRGNGGELTLSRTGFGEPVNWRSFQSAKYYARSITCEVLHAKYIRSMTSEVLPGITGQPFQVSHRPHALQSSVIAVVGLSVVVAAIDQEKEKANAEAAGGGGGGGGSDAGGSVSRRDGKQIDLLLEVESLEPKQLMSVGGCLSLLPAVCCFRAYVWVCFLDTSILPNSVCLSVCLSD